MASLEGAAHGFAFASGMAAEDAVLRSLRPGDHLIVPNDAYGGTWRLIDKVYGPMGVTHTAVALSDVDAVAAAWTPATKLVWVETPSNPLLSIADIGALSAVGPRQRRPVRGRQHLRHPVPAAPARARGRRRRALDDQVPGRPLRRGRRPGRRRTTTSWAEELFFIRNATGAVSVALQRLPGPARPEDPGRAHGTPLPGGPRRGRLPARPPPGAGGALAGPGHPPRLRGGPPPDAGLRRHGQLRRRRGRRGRRPRSSPARRCSPWPSPSARWSPSSSSPR